jgi:ubiquinone/menaquinone biosynthesis C-methylase UbiE
MRIDFKPENPIEWIAMKANLGPYPSTAFIMVFAAKIAMLAFKYDVFESVKGSPQTVEEIAQKVNLHPRGLRSLLNALVVGGYLECKNGKFSLNKISKKWCLKENPENSMYSQMAYYHEVLWNNEINYMDEFLKTGKGIQIHDTYTEEQWDLYQLAMEEQARMTVQQSASMMPMLKDATQMLDIGGSHGMYSVELCKKYPNLKSIILELPQAVERSQKGLAKYNMGDRVNYLSGNVLTDDLGENRYDLILMSQLAHHFTAEQNEVVCKKVMKALKPNACFVIQEYLRPETSNKMDTVPIILDMYFNVSSTSGLWSLDELKCFQQKAGLVNYKVNRFKGMSCFAQVCAQKV